MPNYAVVEDEALIELRSTKL